MWTTNKNKSMNKWISKFVPKTTYLCNSIVAKTRMHTAVGIDSIGYEGYFQCLFIMLGMKYNNTIIKQQHVTIDKRKKYFIAYNQRDEVRKHKGERSAEKMKQMIIDTRDDELKGRKYKSGMAGPSMKKNKKNGEEGKIGKDFCICCNIIS